MIAHPFIIIGNGNEIIITIIILIIMMILIIQQRSADHEVIIRMILYHISVCNCRSVVDGNIIIIHLFTSLFNRLISLIAMCDGI